MQHGRKLVILLSVALLLGCQDSEVLPEATPFPPATPSSEADTRPAESRIRVDLDVDTDRDGVVTDASDEAGEERWSEERGALFMANFDDDDLDGVIDAIDSNRAGEPVDEDRTINGPQDAEDITPLVVRLGATGPSRLRVLLSTPELDQVRAVHLFPGNTAGLETVWGGPLEEAAEIDITPWVRFGASTTLGLEGLFFRYTRPGAYGVFPEGYDGFLDLELRVVNDAGEELGSDAVRLKVAPLILLPNTQPTEEVWALSYNRPDDPSTSFEDESAYNGVLSEALSGSERLRVYTEGGDQWTQDHVEFGYTHAPGRPKTNVALVLPRRSPVTWPRDHLLGHDNALLSFRNTVKLDAGSGVGDYGGNIEVMPPTSAWPLGRTMVGSSISPQLLQFLQDQEVQPILEVDVTWLASEHVDDVVGFLPTADGWSGITADPSLAMALLDDQPDDAVLFAVGGAVSGRGLAAGDDGVTLESPAGAGGGLGWPEARYLRIYAGTGAGQVAEIAPGDGGRFTVTWVWQTSESLYYLPGHPDAQEQCVYECTENFRVPSGETWLVRPDASSRWVAVEETLFWRDERNRPVPAVITAGEVRNDPHLRTLNRKAATRVKALQDAIGDAAGMPVSFVSVPVAFMGIFPTENLLDGNAVALTSNLATSSLPAASSTSLRPRGPRAAAGRTSSRRRRGAGCRATRRCSSTCGTTIACWGKCTV